MYSTCPLILFKVNDDLTHSNPTDPSFFVFFGFFITLNIVDHSFHLSPHSLTAPFQSPLLSPLFPSLMKCCGSHGSITGHFLLSFYSVPPGAISSVLITPVAVFMLKTLQSENLNQIFFVSNYKDLNQDCLSLESVVSVYGGFFQKEKSYIFLTHFLVKMHSCAFLNTALSDSWHQLVLVICLTE